MPLWRGGPNNRTLPAHCSTTTKQGSRHGPLVCPSKPSSRGLQRICSRHPSMRHSRERLSSRRNHHIERRRIIETGESQRFSWGLFVGSLTSQKHASVSQGRVWSDNCTCCYTETVVADPTFHLTQSQYTDTGPTSPSDDPTTPGAWQGSHWSANF